LKSVGIASRSATWLGNRKLSRLMALVATILLVTLVVGLLAFLLIQDKLAYGTFPAAVSIVGVDVSGLTRTEAVARLERDLKGVADKPLAIKVDQETYQITPREIGVTLEYDKMVDEAYERAWSVPIYERAARRFMNKPKTIKVDLLASQDDTLVRDFVSRAINQVNRHPKDAYVDVTSGAPVIVKAQDGRQADFDELLAATKQALGTTKRTVNARVDRVPPVIVDSMFGKFIIINLAAFSLTLYNREQPLAQFPVACGSPSYPSPAGMWKVVEKQRNPSWKNPGSAWAKSMPAYIPPGPGNPLGTRALALNASGVLIHGTSNSGSIGSPASHGCIRMRMPDVEALFEMVEANIPVYIIRGPGNPGFDVTRRPEWWARE